MWKYPPVGPSSGRVARRTGVIAPSTSPSGARGPPMSVLTQPGWIEFTLIAVSCNSCDRWRVNEFNADLEASYENVLVA